MAGGDAASEAAIAAARLGVRFNRTGSVGSNTHAHMQGDMAMLTEEAISKRALLKSDASIRQLAWSWWDEMLSTGAFGSPENEDPLQKHLAAAISEGGRAAERLKQGMKEEAEEGGGKEKGKKNKRGKETAAPPTTPVAPLHDKKVLRRDGYVRMNGALHKHLVESGTDEEALAAAEMDWGSDSKGKAAMDFDMFYDSVYELVDHWTDGLMPKDYCATMKNFKDLHKRVEEAEIERMRLEAYESSKAEELAAARAAAALAEERQRQQQQQGLKVGDRVWYTSSACGTRDRPKVRDL